MELNTILNELRRLREYSQLTEALGAQLRELRPLPILLTGLCEGAWYAFTAAAASDIATGIVSKKKKPLSLIILPEERDCSRLAAFLLSAGLKVKFLPVRDYNFNNIRASHDTEYERLSVLRAVADKSTDVIITVPDALLMYTMPREKLDKLTLSLKIGTELDLSAFIDFLVHCGYTRVETVDGAGQFAVRGGIVDVFIPRTAEIAEEENFAVRVELFGDEIDRIGLFDIGTQRIDRNINEITVSPAREVIADIDAVKRIAASINSLMRTVGDADRRISLNEELDTLKSGADLASIDKYMPLVYPERECALDYFDGDCIIFIRDINAVSERAASSEKLLLQSAEDMITSKSVHSSAAEYYTTASRLFETFASRNPSVIINTFANASAGSKLGGLFDFRTRQTPPAVEFTQTLKDDITSMTASKYRVMMIAETEPEARDIAKSLNDDGIQAFYSETCDNLTDGTVALTWGAYVSGFEIQATRFALICPGGVVVRRTVKRSSEKRQRQNEQKIMSYADLEPGDYVVHAAYGIGQYTGIENIGVDGIFKDYITVCYAGKDKLFVPVESLELVSKYIGAKSSDGTVKLSKMGGAEWHRATAKAKASTKEMAKELIQLYAERMRKPGFSYAPDDDLQREFESGFEYEETDAQLIAADEIKRDMEKSVPMERLLCGDVGYGKTEVALRAAFKAINNGKQVALLCPTTILAFQHFTTATSRMRGYPLTIDYISRFKSANAQAETIRKLRRGDIDLLIGTHRIISDDVKFKDLGLLIVDEEQRFGVAQKEKLKQITEANPTPVDVLTLTATPIPRTLNMAMSGIRDMSVLDEAPQNRLPVQSYVLEHDDSIINEAIRRELRRGGQVFYLYNRIEGIYNVAGRIQAAFPEAHIAIAHGQMEKDELEDIWSSLVAGETDILVSTTIIETGVDVPNANTLIIENADRLGLAQLHQIRGRVGRSSRRAYAYFTYKKGKALSEIAEKRLQAIRDYAEFGAGFKIAMRDLEIRGAGNLLGAQQHGNLEAVGYDLYIKLLNEAVLEERGEKVTPKTESSVSLRADAYITQDYISASATRMEMYNKIAHIEYADDYNDALDELSDRFGEIPPQTEELLRVALIRGISSRIGIKKVTESAGELSFEPEKLNVVIWSEIFEEEKSSSPLRIAMGGTARVVCKIKKGVLASEVAVRILKSYDKIEKTAKETSK